MKQKIFLLIVTFCIVQVKSYPGNFPGAVLLSDASSLWGEDESKHSCFQDCYKKKNASHREAVVTCSYQILEAANDLKSRLGGIRDFQVHAPKIPTSANKLGNLLEDYQESFSTLVKEGKFNEIQELMKNYETKIEKIEKALENDFATLKQRTIMQMYKDAIKQCEKTIEDELQKVTDASEQVLDLLKKCMDKNCKKRLRTHK